MLQVNADGNHLMVDNYLFTHCICNISLCKIKILDPKNVENDVLHATFGRVVNELQLRCVNSKHASVQHQQQLSSSTHRLSPPNQTAMLHHSPSCQLRLVLCPMRPFLMSFKLYVLLLGCRLMMIQLLCRWLSSPQHRK